MEKRNTLSSVTMTTISLEEAQANLPALFRNLAPGEVVVVTQDDQPVGRLIGSSPQRKLGTMCGTVKHMAPDFDAPLDDFEEYTR